MSYSNTHYEQIPVVSRTLFYKCRKCDKVSYGNTPIHAKNCSVPNEIAADEKKAKEAAKRITSPSSSVRLCYTCNTFIPGHHDDNNYMCAKCTLKK